MAEQERPGGVRRRSSLGRAFDRVRDALKRRRSSQASGAVLQTASEEEATATATTSIPERQLVETRETPQHEEIIVSKPKATVHGESVVDSQLVPDDRVADEPDGNEEALTPAFSSRFGVDEEKAKALFNRYGLRYQPRTPVQTESSAPASKIRRVEKPVRIRIHWTCHECARQFGHDRACMHCGHRKCGACTRSPPKKVRAILDEARKAQVVDEQVAKANKEQILAAISPGTVASPSKPEPPLEVDDVEDEKDAPEFTMQQRPRSAIDLVVRPKAPSMRRICHDCQTPFTSNNANKCEGCGHERCPACPMRSTKPQGEDENLFKPTMVATVQRVHRKPRQRVRWTCDRCNGIFAPGEPCRSCEHQRCEACVRSPAKRIPRQPDPAVVQSVNEKLAHWDRQRNQQGR